MVREGGRKGGREGGREGGKRGGRREQGKIRGRENRGKNTVGSQIYAINLFMRNAVFQFFAKIKFAN